MDIKRRRLPARGRLAKCAVDYAFRKLSQVPATSGGNRVAEHVGRCQRKLGKLASTRVDQMGNARTIGIAVAVTPNRKKTRVILVPFFEQDLKSPFPSRNNGKAGRAVAEYRLSNQIFKRTLGRPNVLAECFPIQCRNALMPVAV